jgi:hypothetical protein
MLGLEPDGERLTSDPVLPEGVGQIELLGVPGRWGAADVTTRDQGKRHPVQPA